MSAGRNKFRLVYKVDIGIIKRLRVIPRRSEVSAHLSAEGLALFAPQVPSSPCLEHFRHGVETSSTVLIVP